MAEEVVKEVGVGPELAGAAGAWLEAFSDGPMKGADSGWEEAQGFELPNRTEEASSCGGRLALAGELQEALRERLCGWEGGLSGMEDGKG